MTRHHYVILSCVGASLLAALVLLRLCSLGWFQASKDVLEALSYLVILIGVPLGLHEYAFAIKKEQLDREYGTYNALDEKFLEFQQLCLKYPGLDIFDVADEHPQSLTDQQKKEEVVAFTILFSIFERAFLMYSDQSTDIKTRQWSGWDTYIRSFAGRENFRSAWGVSGGTFDTGFEQYMAGLMRLNGPSEAEA